MNAILTSNRKGYCRFASSIYRVCFVLFFVNCLALEGFGQLNYSWGHAFMGPYYSGNFSCVNYPDYLDGANINYDQSGNLIVLSEQTGQVDMDISSGLSTSPNSDGFVIAKYSGAGLLLWTGNIVGGWSALSFGEFATDASGNIYLTGGFTGTIDIDPSNAVFNLTGSSTESIFVAKISSSGGLLWAYAFQSGYACSGQSVAVDNSGNPIFTGSFRGTVDFDPSSGTSNLATISTGHSGTYLVKFSSSGSLIFAKDFTNTTSSSSSYGIDMDINSVGEIVITGTFGGTVDFDPGSGSYPLTSSPASEYIAKLSGSGSIVWAGALMSIGTIGVNHSKLQINSNDEVVIAGTFSGSVDFDPGTGTNILTTNSTYNNFFIAEFNNSGALNWVVDIPDAYYGSSGFDMELSATDHIWITGSYGNPTFSYVTDVDPGSGVWNLLSPNGLNALLLEFDPNGSLLYAQSLYPCNNSYGYSLAVGPSNEFAIAGELWGNRDFDFGAGTAMLGLPTYCQTVYLATYNYIPGTIYTPEIDIMGLSNSISAGDVTPSISDDTDFGIASLGSPVTHTFTIHNTGTGTLNIYNVSVPWPGSAEFTVSTQPPSSIASGGSATFQIEYNPTVAGIHNATIEVLSNDADEAYYDFAITGSTIIGQPYALFSASPTPAACNQSITFDGSASYHDEASLNIVLYEWDFDYNGSNFTVDATGQVANYAYPQFGTYTVALRVADNLLPNAQTDITTDVVQVNLGNQPPVANAGTGWTQPFNIPVSLNGSNSFDPNTACGDQIVTYQWDINSDGVADLSGSNPSFTSTDLQNLGVVNILGPHTIDLRVFDSFGASGSHSIIINLSALPAGSLHFDGSDDVVDLGNVLNFGNGDFSLECWFQANVIPSGSSNQVHLVNKGMLGTSGSNFTGYGLTLHYAWPNVGARFTTEENGQVQMVEYTSINPLHGWHHLAATRGGGTLRLYVDGQLVATSIYISPLDVNTNEVCALGGSLRSVTYPEDRNLFGHLEEFRFWNKELCAKEIVDRMNCELVGNEADLAAYYSFNQAGAYSQAPNPGATLLSDVAGNYNGQLQNFALATYQSNWVNQYNGVSGTCSPVVCPPSFTANTNVDFNVPSNWTGTLTVPPGAFDDIEIGVYTYLGPVISGFVLAEVHNIYFNNNVPIVVNAGATLRIHGDIHGDARFEGEGIIEFSPGNHNLHGDVKAHGIVEIGSGATIVSNGHLILEDGAVLLHGAGTMMTDGTIGGGDVIGDIKVRREGSQNGLQQNQWGTPVTGPSANQLGSFVWEFNEQNNDPNDYINDWQLATGHLHEGRGYSVAGAGHQIFSGLAGNGSYIVNVHSTSSSNTSEDGWNLVANPYPSVLDASKLVLANPGIDGTLYFWSDPGTGAASYQSTHYASWNMSGSTSTGGGSNSPNGYIPVAQGFFVHKTNNGTGDIAFNNGMRAYNQADFFRQAIHPRLKLNIKDENGAFDETLIALHPDATDGWDRLFDGKKVMGNSLGLFTELDHEPFAIQAFMPIWEGEKKLIPLIFTPSVAGDYSIEISQFEGLDNYQVWLEDRTRKVMIPLSQTARYEFFFNDEAREVRNRFVVHIHRKDIEIIGQMDDPSDRPVGLQTTENDYHVFRIDDIIEFKSETSKTGTITVYNSQGQLVAKRNLHSETNASITLPNAVGIHLVAITIDNIAGVHKLNFTH